MGARSFATTLLLIISGVNILFGQTDSPFRNPNLPIEQRIDNLLQVMTLDEKLAILGTNTAVPRLGIANAGSSEGLHGLVMKGRGGRFPAIGTTQFAQAVGMAETWDPDLMRKAGAVEGYEARYITQSGKYHRAALVIWAPNADLARDPRWGRTEESYGEDPFFNGTMAVAFIHGLQGEEPKYWQTASLLKHFMANSNEDGRTGSSSDFDVRLMREYYSVPFRMGFEQGGAQAFMESYNAWDKIPMAANPIVKTLIHEWSIGGIISTDGGGMRHMFTYHKYVPSLEASAAAILKVGTNQYLDPYLNPLKEALKDNMVTEADIDSSLRGKLRTIIHLGLVDPPELVAYTKIKEGEEPWNTDRDKDVAKAMARESIVLLKNEGSFLPLKQAALKSIAVIGPHANEVLLDYYSGPAPYLVSPLQGIQDKVGPSVKVTYTPDNTDDAAVKAAKAADVAVVVVGNHPWCGIARDAPNTWNSDASTVPCADPAEGREGRDRTSLTLQQEELVKQVYAANPKTVMVLVTSFPYAIVWSQAHVPAILRATHTTQELGNALAAVLFGDYNPSGKLTATWPSSLDQLPPMMDYNIRHGRTYMYFKGEPLYPFGYGLSYTTFRYSHLRTSAGSMKKDGVVSVSVDVRNTGTMAGDEVVQLYVTHVGSKVDRPLKELKGFARVALQSGETKTVEIPLQAESLAYWDETANHFVVEKDDVKIMVGSSSADLRAEKSIHVTP